MFWSMSNICFICFIVFLIKKKTEWGVRNQTLYIIHSPLQMFFENMRWLAFNLKQPKLPGRKVSMKNALGSVGSQEDLEGFSWFPSMIWEHHPKCGYHLLVPVQIKGQTHVYLVFTLASKFILTIASCGDSSGDAKTKFLVACIVACLSKT